MKVKAINVDPDCDWITQGKEYHIKHSVIVDDKGRLCVIYHERLDDETTQDYYEWESITNDISENE